MAAPRKVPDQVELQNRMVRCAEILYQLRYGRKGAVMIRQAAPYTWESFEEMNSKPAKRHFLTVMKEVDSQNRRALVSRQKVIGFTTVEKQDFPLLQTKKPLTEAKGLEIVLWPPIDPCEEAWNALKRKKASEAEIGTVAQRIRHWSKKVDVTLCIGGETNSSTQMADVIREGALQLRQAKKLPHYPQSEKRSRSEDKRIQFLAKVIAGLSLGISPLYATKKLSKVRLTSGEALNWEPLRSLYPFLICKKTKNETGEDNESPVRGCREFHRREEV